MEINRRKKINEYDDKTVLELVMFCLFYFTGKIPIDILNKLKPCSNRTWSRYAMELSSDELIPPGIRLRKFEEEKYYTTKDEIDGYVDEYSPATPWSVDPLYILYNNDTFDSHHKRLLRLAYMAIEYADWDSRYVLFEEDLKKIIDTDNENDELFPAYEDYKRSFDVEDKTFIRDLKVLLLAMAVVDEEWKQKLEDYRNGRMTILKNIEY